MKPQWQQFERQRIESLREATRTMCEWAALQPGQHVIDIGSGSGDMALLAAQSVGPGGGVLASDISSESLEGLRVRMQTLRNAAKISIEVVAAENISSVGLFDVALARNSLMYFDDLDQGLRAVRRAIRAGGRFVASVWGAEHVNPFHAVPLSVVRQWGSSGGEYAKACGLSVETLRRACHEVGFTDIETTSVSADRTYASLNEAMTQFRSFPPLVRLLESVPTSEHERAWFEICEGFNKVMASEVRLPGQQVILKGIA